ncbi:50S ribosomal protein L11 methyltransferase [Candidatus Poseidoniales archaeon]|nr:50S ribosomal protein L11 methyltransferase [Candidatus Poseidoniales archaeon]
MFDEKKTFREIELLASEAREICWKNFNLTIPHTVYPPREDTDLLASVLDKVTPFGKKRLLEIGSGSGALSILAASMGWEVEACDINPFAVAATRYNAAENNFLITSSEGGIGPAKDGLHSQWMKPGSYDAVIWNMPYIPAEEIEEYLGPMEDAALVDTHPSGLIHEFAEMTRRFQLIAPTGIALILCREHIGALRTKDILLAKGLATQRVSKRTFDDEETIQVLAVWHPFVTSKKQQMHSVPSTNSEILEGSYKPGDSLRTRFQTDGKGRHGRTWHDHLDSFKGSWKLNPDQIPQISSQLQCQVALEITSLLQSMAPKENVLQVKWPNDILIRDSKSKDWKKAGGILFQSLSRGTKQSLVLGIGINTKSTADVRGQGSLEEIGINLDNTELFTLLDTIVSSLFENKSNLVNTSVNSTGLNLDLLLKECIYRTKQCTVRGVSEEGYLQIESSHGESYDIADDLSLLWPHLQLQ